MLELILKKKTFFAKLGPVHMGRSYLGYRENISKGCIAFIWDEKFSRVPRSRLLTSEISVTEIIFIPYEHNFLASEKTFCLHFTKSTSQRETLPGKRENI